MPIFASPKNGAFKIVVPLKDPNEDGTTPDVSIKVFFENDNFRVYDGHKTHSQQDIKVYKNISGPIFTYGEFKLSQAQISSKIGHVFNTLQPVYDWYVSDVKYTPLKSIIDWDPDLCLAIGVSPNNGILTLTDVVNSAGRKCHPYITSSLENPHTLRHEYAHQTHNQKYIARDSTINDKDCKPTHSPVHPSGPLCAWTEGWAFFMATAFDLNPSYQPNYMYGQWNFETRTNTVLGQVLWTHKMI